MQVWMNFFEPNLIEISLETQENISKSAKFTDLEIFSCVSHKILNMAYKNSQRVILISIILITIWKVRGKSLYRFRENRPRSVEFINLEIFFT